MDGDYDATFYNWLYCPAPYPFTSASVWQVVYTPGGTPAGSTSRGCPWTGWNCTNWPLELIDWYFQEEFDYAYGGTALSHGAYHTGSVRRTCIFFTAPGDAWCTP